MNRTKRTLVASLLFIAASFSYATCDQPFCAVDASTSTTESATTLIGDDESLLENNSDFFSFTYVLASQPSKGVVTNNNNGTFTFDPNSEFDDLGTGQSEEVSFTFYITEPSPITSNTATVSVTVNGEGAVAKMRIESDVKLYDEFNEDGVLSAGERVHVGFVFRPTDSRPNTHDYFISGWSDYLELLDYQTYYSNVERDVFDYNSSQNTIPNKFHIFISTSGDEPKLQLDTTADDNLGINSHMAFHLLFEVKEGVSLEGVPDIKASEVSYFPTTELFTEAVTLPLQNSPDPDAVVYKQNQPAFEDGEITLHVMVRNPVGSSEGDIQANTEIGIAQIVGSTSFSCAGVRLKTESLKSTLSSGDISVSCGNSNQTITIDYTDMPLVEDSFLVVPLAIAFDANPYTGTEWQFDTEVTVNPSEIVPLIMPKLTPAPYTSLFSETYLDLLFHAGDSGITPYKGSTLYLEVENENYFEYDSGTLKVLLDMDSDFDCEKFQNLYVSKSDLASDATYIDCAGHLLAITISDAIGAEEATSIFYLTFGEQFGELLSDVSSRFKGHAYLSANDMSINTVVPFNQTTEYNRLTKEEEEKVESLSAFAALLACGFAFWFYRRRSRHQAE